MTIKRKKDGTFQKGGHWREHAIFREKAYLIREYVKKKRSAVEIAAEHGVGHTAIYFWLKKHRIPTRSTSETRAIKKWGSSGVYNGMYGKRGSKSPSWKGGISPTRQKVYATERWKKVYRFVWNRDDGKCRRCEVDAAEGFELHIHHIKSFNDYPKLRTNAINLILLCSKCHGWVHRKENIGKAFRRVKKTIGKNP